jgi:hypothetical protein
VHTDLNGEGARLFGGRWNSAGRPVVYLSEHPALAALEVRVLLDLPLELLPADFVLIQVVLASGFDGGTGGAGVALVHRHSGEPGFRQRLGPIGTGRPAGDGHISIRDLRPPGANNSTGKPFPKVW